MMARFNLYIPTIQERLRWEKYANKARRSLSDFIRMSVYEKIQRMKQEEEIEKERGINETHNP